MDRYPQAPLTALQACRWRFLILLLLMTHPFEVTSLVTNVNTYMILPIPENARWSRNSFLCRKAVECRPELSYRFDW